MSTPVGHSLVGLSICFLVLRKLSKLSFSLIPPTPFIKGKFNLPSSPFSKGGGRIGGARLPPACCPPAGEAGRSRAGQGNRWERSWKALLFCAVIACLPDIDFLPGIFIGNVNYYHHKGTHSIFFAFIVLLAVWALARKRNGFKLGIIAFILVLSHLAIDYISIDRVAPFGMPFLWPFSGEYFYFRHAFLPEVLRGNSVISIFNGHNLRTVIVELFIFLPVAFLSYRIGISTIYSSAQSPQPPLLKGEQGGLEEPACRPPAGEAGRGKGRGIGGCS